jgi:hypothetical protein
VIYEETRGVLKTFLEGVIRDAVTYTEVSSPSWPGLDNEADFFLARQAKDCYIAGCCLCSQETGPHSLWFRWLDSCLWIYEFLDSDSGVCLYYGGWDNHLGVYGIVVWNTNLIATMIMILFVRETFGFVDVR